MCVCVCVCIRMIPWVSVCVCVYLCSNLYVLVCAYKPMWCVRVCEWLCSNLCVLVCTYKPVWYVCVYICLSLCVCVCVYLEPSVWVSVGKCVLAYVFMCVSLCVCVCAWVWFKINLTYIFFLLNTTWGSSVSSTFTRTLALIRFSMLVFCQWGNWSTQYNLLFPFSLSGINYSTL